MKLSIKLLSILLVLGIMSCDRFKTTTTPDGDRLIVHEKGKSGKLGKVGDIMTFDLVIKNSLDSTLKNSFKEGQPFMVPLQKGQFKGSFENALFHISEGDSTTVLVSADSLISAMKKGNPNQPLPPSLIAGSDLKFTVKMKKIQSQADFQKELTDKKTNEPKFIEDFVTKNLAGATKSADGIYTKIVKPGTGASPVAGDTVTVGYVGKFIDGKVFDQSKPGQPFSFPVGKGYVIPGWEKALMGMKAGEKATVVIPSILGYGDQGAGGVIPPNTPLVFDIELVSVKK